MVAQYPTVTSGTTITATWGNTVRDGLVNVFSTSASRASAITAPGEGMVTYLTNSNTLEFYDGAAWQNVIQNMPVTVAQATNMTKTSNTVLLASDLTLPVAASTSYTLHALLFYTAGQTGDMSIGLNVPAGASYRVVPRGLPSTHGGGESGSFFVGGHSSSPVGIFGGSDGGEVLSGELHGQINIGGTAGTVDVTMAQSVGSSTSTVLLTKSFLTLQRFAP